MKIIKFLTIVIISLFILQILSMSNSLSMIKNIEPESVEAAQCDPELGCGDPKPPPKEPTPNKAPTATVYSPSTNQMIEALSFTISGNGKDLDGTVIALYFYLDSHLVKSYSTSASSVTQTFTHTVDIETFNPGAHTIRVRAKDNNGAIGESSKTFYFFADPFPPTVSILLPSVNQQFAPNQGFTFEASASDNDHVSSVDFYVNDVLKFTDPSAPYYYTESLSQVGTYTLKAKAYDDYGQSATALRSISVVNPSVSIVSPTEGQILGKYDENIFTFNRYSPYIYHINLYINNQLETTLNSAQTQYSWDTSEKELGSYTIRAELIDHVGNTASSGDREVFLIFGDAHSDHFESQFGSFWTTEFSDFDQDFEWLSVNGHAVPEIKSGVDSNDYTYLSQEISPVTGTFGVSIDIHKEARDEASGFFLELYDINQNLMGRAGVNDDSTNKNYEEYVYLRPETGLPYQYFSISLSNNFHKTVLFTRDQSNNLKVFLNGYEYGSVSNSNPVGKIAIMFHAKYASTTDSELIGINNHLWVDNFEFGWYEQAYLTANYFVSNLPDNIQTQDINLLDQTTFNLDLFLEDEQDTLIEGNIPIEISYETDGIINSFRSSIINGHSNISLPEYIPEVDIEILENPFVFSEIKTVPDTTIKEFVLRMGPKSNTPEENLKTLLFQKYITSNNVFSYNPEEKTYKMAKDLDLTFGHYDLFSNRADKWGYTVSNGFDVIFSEDEVFSGNYKSDLIEIDYYDPSNGYSSCGISICTSKTKSIPYSVTKFEFLSIWLNILIAGKWDKSGFPLPHVTEFLDMFVNGYIQDLLDSQQPVPDPNLNLRLQVCSVCPPGLLPVPAIPGPILAALFVIGIMLVADAVVDSLQAESVTFNSIFYINGEPATFESIFSSYSIFVRELTSLFMNNYLSTIIDQDQGYWQDTNLGIGERIDDNLERSKTRGDDKPPTDPDNEPSLLVKILGVITATWLFLQPFIIGTVTIFSNPPPPSPTEPDNPETKENPKTTLDVEYLNKYSNPYKHPTDANGYLDDASFYESLKRSYGSFVQLSIEYGKATSLIAGGLAVKEEIDNLNQIDDAVDYVFKEKDNKWPNLVIDGFYGAYTSAIFLLKYNEKFPNEPSILEIVNFERDESSKYPGDHRNPDFLISYDFNNIFVEAKLRESTSDPSYSKVDQGLGEAYYQILELSRAFSSLKKEFCGISVYSNAYKTLFFAWVTLYV